MSGEERLTANVLVLELSTMIVAIALALDSQSLEGRLSLGSLLDFIVVNIVVIYFWWDYVVNRLHYPPPQDRFPLLDVIILMLISVLPAALRSGNELYISGIMASMSFAWSYIIRGFSRQGGLPRQAVEDLRRESRVRAWVGALFLASMAAELVSRPLGHLLLVMTVILLAYRALVRWLRSRALQVYHFK